MHVVPFAITTLFAMHEQPSWVCCEDATAMQAPCMRRNSGAIPGKCGRRLRRAYVVCTWNCLKIIEIINANTQVDTAHSSESKLCIHNNAHMVSTDKHSQANHHKPLHDIGYPQF
jgi:hypothetical protein